MIVWETEYLSKCDVAGHPREHYIAFKAVFDGFVVNYAHTKLSTKHILLCDSSRIVCTQTIQDVVIVLFLMDYTQVCSNWPSDNAYENRRMVYSMVAVGPRVFGCLSPRHWDLAYHGLGVLILYI